MRILKNVFTITVIFIIHSCDIYYNHRTLSNLNFKNKLNEEVTVYIDYLNKIKGKDSNRVILVTKYKKEKLTLYLFENYDFYFTNYEKDFQYENCPTLVPTEVSLDGFKFINNTLVCLYNNEDLPGVDLSINRIPKKYKSISYALLYNPEFTTKTDNLSLLSKINEHKERMFYVIIARIKNKPCLYEIKYTDQNYENFRKKLITNPQNCLGIDFW